MPTSLPWFKCYLVVPYFLKAERGLIAGKIHFSYLLPISALLCLPEIFRDTDYYLTARADSPPLSFGSQTWQYLNKQTGLLIFNFSSSLPWFYLWIQHTEMVFWVLPTSVFWLCWVIIMKTLWLTSNIDIVKMNAD